MSQLTRLDAATLSAKIAAKEVSSTEVTQACLDQIASTMPGAGTLTVKSPMASMHS